jgi:hypothetical protein
LPYGQMEPFLVIRVKSFETTNRSLCDGIVEGGRRL